MPKARIIPDGNDIMNVEQVATYFGVGVRVIYRVAKDGEVPAFRFGDTWRFSRLALEEWSKKQAMGNLR